MNPESRREELKLLLDRRREELSKRMDISERTRQLSQSNSRNQLIPPKLKRRTTLTMILAGLAGVAIVLCVGSAIALAAGGMWLGSQLSDPSTTVQRFYGSVRQQNYAAAYGLFSSQARKNLSQTTFSERFASYDAIDGIVEAYPVVSSTTNGSTATVVVDEVRRGDTSMARARTFTLVQENNNWLIASIASGGKVPIPSPTP